MSRPFSMVKKQSRFCLDLMERLDSMIQGANVMRSGIFEHHSVMEDDIIRLRRELNDLRKMLAPYKEDKEEQGWF